MTESARIPVEIQLILNKWTRDARTVVRDARAIDQALDDAKRSAKQLAATLNSIKSGKIAFDVDLSAIDKAASAAKSLDGLSPDVTVQVDTSQIMGAEIDLQTLDNVSPKVTVDVSVDAAQVQTQLNSITAPDLEVEIHGDATAAKAVLDSLKAPAPIIVEIDADDTKADTRIDNVGRRTPKVTADVDADTSRAESAIDDLRKQPPIQLTFDVSNLPSMIGGGVGAATGFIGTIGELDAAVGKVTARTKLDAETAEAALRSAYLGAFGESYDQLAEYLSLTAQLPSANANLEASFTSAMTTADVTGQDFVKTLEVMDKLVSTGLVDNFTAAQDLIVGGFQLGANRSDDFLDTLREYAIQFEAGGVSAATAVDLMVQALDAGAFNTDKVADTIKENLLKINEAAGDVGGAGGTAKPILEQMGLMDEASAVAAGELSSTAFAETFITTLNEQLASGVIDEDQVRFMMTEVFGTPIEDLGIDLFKNLDFSGENAPDFTGVGEAAGTAIYDNISTKLLELKRVLEDEFITALKQGGLDFGALIDDAKTKIGEIAAILKEGVALPEALEIVLQTPGLADAFHQFESVMGNLIIGIGTIVADVITLVSGEDAAAGIRAGVAQQSERQLTFDIQLADDAQGIVDAVNLAMLRGVSEGDAGAAVSLAIADMISEGAIGSAQTLLTELGDNLDLTAGRGAFMEAIATLNEDINAALAEGDVLGAVKIFDAAGLEEDARAMAQPLVTALLDEMSVAAQTGDWFKAVQMANPLEEMGLLPDDQMFGLMQDKLQEQLEGVLSNIGNTMKGLKSGELTIFEDLSVGATNLAASQEELNAAMINPVQVVAGALAFDQYDRAMRKATEAGWPITQEQLEMFAGVEGGVQAIAGQLSLYVNGLGDAERDSVAALEGLKTQGIDVVIAAENEMLLGMDAYVLGVRSGLQENIVAWQAYIDWLAENGLTLDTVITPPTIPGGGDLPSYDVGSRGIPFDQIAKVHKNEVILTPHASDALNTLLGFFQMGGAGGGNTSNVTNNINVNVLQNNNSQAAGNASAGTLSAQLRGFAR